MRVYRVEWRGGEIERRLADDLTSLITALIAEGRDNNVVRIDQGLMPL